MPNLRELFLCEATATTSPKLFWLEDVLQPPDEILCLSKKRNCYFRNEHDVPGKAHWVITVTKATRFNGTFFFLVIVSIIKFSIVIGSLRAYVS